MHQINVASVLVLTRPNRPDTLQVTTDLPPGFPLSHDKTATLQMTLASGTGVTYAATHFPNAPLETIEG